MINSINGRNSESNVGEFTIGAFREDANTHLLEGRVLATNSKTQKTSPGIFRYQLSITAIRK